MIRNFPRLIASRWLPPLVLALFLFVYIWLAFFSEEPLIMLMEISRRNFLLVALLALLPLSYAARILIEILQFLNRRKLLKKPCCRDNSLSGFEIITLSVSPDLDRVGCRLAAAGYKTRLAENSLSAWKGFSFFPARILYMAACFALFSGIILSLTTRSTRREALIEGEMFSVPGGGEATIDRISLKTLQGLLLARDLSVEMTTASGREIRSGLYPPALMNGSFLYHRYLGIAPLVRFHAPDLPLGFETHFILMIYPPGKEDSADIPGTAYRINFSMRPQEDAEDPYVTGRLTLNFKLLKGKEHLYSGSIPVGKEFQSGGYRIEFADFRRVTATDLVKDYGVILLWCASVLFATSFLYWLPVRLFFPRHEMIFSLSDDSFQAASRLECEAHARASVFAEILDSVVEK